MTYTILTRVVVLSMTTARPGSLNATRGGCCVTGLDLSERAKHPLAP